MTFDTENTGALRNKANPFDPRNECVLLSYRDPDVGTTSIDPIDIDEFRQKVDTTDWIIGFNLKYDMHWGRRYGVSFKGKKLWDVQLVHFILTGQKNAYPSLNEVAEYYGLPCKLDVVKTEYWEVGLDTDQVPWDILLEYCEHDVWLTEQCARRQMQEYRNCSRQLQTTIRVALDDLHALQEMEWNGFYYNQNRSFEEASVLLERAGEIKQSLGTLTNTAELNINWGSTDQVSAVLYGGTVKRIENETYLFEYKDPRKQPVQKTRKVEKFYELPRIVAPAKGSELKKEGVWATNEGALRSLKANKKVKIIVDLLLELAKLDKLVDTYFLGMPKKIEEYGWSDSFIHTNLSSCVTKTGRLASGKPNLQNIPSPNKICFESRFKRK